MMEAVQEKTLSIEDMRAGLESMYENTDENIQVTGRAITERCAKESTSIPGLPDVSDIGNSERLFNLCGNRVRYSFDSGQYHVWNGRIWTPDCAAQLNRWAVKSAKGIYKEIPKVNDGKKYKMYFARLMKHAASSGGRSRLDAAIDLMKSHEKVEILASEFDSDPYLFCFANGTLNLKTGKLQKHDKTDLITKMSPVKYDENAKSGIWESFLDSITQNDKELKLFLQRVAGYSLCGDDSEEKLFFLYGASATGKTSFKDALKSVMGSYAVTADISTFLKSRGVNTGPRPDIARLAGSRMVISDEIDEGATLAAGLVKLWAGGDTLVARFLYKEHFEFRSRGKLWLIANHAPKVSASDGAMWRRILRVPFLHEIPEEEQDHGLKKVLCDTKETGPAIASWMAEGCLMWQDNGLDVPEAVKLSTEEYKSEQNPVSGFLNDRCEVDIDNLTIQTTSEDLWGEYERWTEDNGIKHHITRIKFGKNLKLHGLQQGQRTGDRARMWYGVQIRNA